MLGRHRVAIICADYVSKRFYTKILGLEVLAKTHRAERNSSKLDLAGRGHYLIELFSFRSPPPRSSYPEAAGLRHLAFAVADLPATVSPSLLPPTGCHWNFMRCSCRSRLNLPSARPVLSSTMLGTLI